MIELIKLLINQQKFVKKNMFKFIPTVVQIHTIRNEREVENLLDTGAQNGNVKTMIAAMKRGAHFHVWHLWEVITSENSEAIVFGFKELSKINVPGTTNPSGKGYPYKELYDEFLSRLLIIPPDEINTEKLMAALPKGEILFLEDKKYYPRMIFSSLRELVEREYEKYVQTVCKVPN